MPLEALERVVERLVVTGAAVQIAVEELARPAVADVILMHAVYQKILNNFKFNKITLISEQKNNPVINYLLKQYPQIVYNKNSLKVDLSYLINAYNIVGSISSLFLIVLQLNENVKNVWDFNIYKNSEKIFHYHYDLYKYPHNFTIFRMEPSEYYKTKMYYWRLTMKQRYLMVNEKCENNFRIINREN